MITFNNGVESDSASYASVRVSLCVFRGIVITCGDDGLKTWCENSNIDALHTLIYIPGYTDMISFMPT